MYLVTKTFVHFSKRMLTQVSALTLVRSPTRWRELNNRYANFRTLRSVFSKKTQSPLVVNVFFWKVETVSQRCS